VSCFGHDEPGNVLPSEIPPRRMPITDARTISVGWFGAAAVRADGSVWSWGPGDCTDDKTPHPVLGVEGAMDARTTGSQQSCALLRDGTVWCWGTNSYGAVGRPVEGTFPCHPDPRPVPGVADVVQIAVSDVHTCALQKDGAVLCWGRVLAGGADTPIPVRTQLPAPARILATAQGATLAITGDGSVYVWGANRSGELGLGTISDWVATPTRVAGLRATAASGDYHTLCVIRDDTSVTCSGENYAGQLGTGKAGDPVPGFMPIGVTGARAITTGTWGSCATRGDGTHVCWGTGPDQEIHTPTPFDPTPM
jgi:hypothetical protein